MSGSTTSRSILWGALIALYLLRLDLWWWNDPSLVLGLPIGLLSQVVFCGLVAVVMALVVRHQWPHELDAIEEVLDRGDSGS